MRPIKEIYADLRNLGITNQYELSRLAGRQPSWMSSLLSRGKQPGLEPLTFLTVNLQRMADANRIRSDETADETAERLLVDADVLDEISNEIWDGIHEICAAQQERRWP